MTNWSDDEIRDAELRLTRLLRDYKLCEPYMPIVLDALTKTYEECFGGMHHEYRLVVRARDKRAYLTEISAVDRLGKLA